MEQAMNNFPKALTEFAKINADLASVKQSYTASSATADRIIGGVKRHESAHIEFSAFTGEAGRVQP